jgi:23S rRNA pseudouridine955/2504/2580 synthase/23S rRNA pseudouridine1911/1915/1917 synthase
MHQTTMQAPSIIVDNAHFIALSKPSGMLTLPDRFDAALPSLKQWLESRYSRIFVVHRIDRDTSGLIVFAKDAETHQYLSQLFESREVEKTYLGLVHGKCSAQEGTLDAPIGEHPVIKGKMAVVRKGKPSITHYRVLEELGAFSWVSFRIETGRTHQIRVHMANAGHPLVADPLYGNGQPLLLSAIKHRFKLSKDAEAERPLLARLALHAHTLGFKAMDGEKISLEAPPTKDLEATLKQLRKWTSR